MSFPFVSRASRSHPGRRSAIVGVEIGANAIHVVRSREPFAAEPGVEEARSFPLDPALPLGSPAMTVLLARSLNMICGTGRNIEIWASASIDKARIDTLEIPRVKNSRLPDAVFWAMKREGDFREAETTIDFEVEENPRSAGAGPLRVTGVLVPKPDLVVIREMFARAGFPLAGFTLPVFALRNLCLRRKRNGEAFALCHIGMNVTTICILDGSRIVFSRSIPTGLKTLGVLPSIGKIEDPQTFDVCRPAIERWVRQIERTLQYYQTTSAVAVKSVCLGGTPAGDERFTKLVSQLLSVELVVLDPWKRKTGRTSPAECESRSSQVDCGVAFGLALASSRQHPNLVRTRKDRQEARAAQTMRHGVLAGFLFATALLGGFYAWQQARIRDLGSERDRLAQTLSQSAPILDEPFLLTTVQEVRANQAAWRQAAQRYEGLALLSELARITPDHIGLLHVSAAWESELPAAEEAPGIRLEGVVTGERTSLETSLTIYVARLERSGLLDAVEVTRTELVQTDNGPCLSFALLMKTGKEPVALTAK